MFNRILQQERTIERLNNERLNSSTQRTTYGTTGTQLEESEPPGNVENSANEESILFRGKGFKTVYYGPSDARSSSAHIPGAISALRDVVSQSPALMRSRRDIETLRNVKRAIDRTEANIAKRDLLSFVPGRGETDYMVETYLNQIDVTYGVLHVPSFQSEYLQFWRDPRASRPAFVALLCLMIACCKCLPQVMPPYFVADSPKPREEAILIVNTCEDWLWKQSRKHVDMIYFQTHYVLLLAKQINSIKLKRAWMETGNLLRLAAASGMHRNTNLLQKKISAFDSEMRRRFWALVVEMDIQASFDRGMTATASDFVSDCGLPSNLRDEDFDTTTTALPPSRPSSEITKVSYSRMSSKSRGLRIRLTNLLNRPDQKASYEDIRTHAEEIEQQLSALPSWQVLEFVSPEATSSTIQTVALLHLQLEQFLLILHGSATRRTVTAVENNSSKTLFLTVAKLVIQQLSKLSASDKKLLVMLRYDPMRVFMSLTHLGISTAKSALAQSVSNDLQPWLELAAQTLEIFEERILRSGIVQWSYCFTLYDVLYRYAFPGATNIESRLGFTLVAAEYEKSTDVTAPARKASNGAPSQGLEAFTSELVVSSNDPFSASSSNPDLSEWNFDDWMLYSESFFQQNLQLPGEELQTMLPASLGRSVREDSPPGGDPASDEESSVIITKPRVMVQEEPKRQAQTDHFTCQSQPQQRTAISSGGSEPDGTGRASSGSSATDCGVVGSPIYGGICQCSPECTHETKIDHAGGWIGDFGVTWEKHEELQALAVALLEDDYNHELFMRDVDLGAERAARLRAERTLERVKRALRTRSTSQQKEEEEEEEASSNEIRNWALFAAIEGIVERASTSFRKDLEDRDETIHQLSLELQLLTQSKGRQEQKLYPISSLQNQFQTQAAQLDERCVLTRRLHGDQRELVLTAMHKTGSAVNGNARDVQRTASY
ncbi:hypothetical protein MBLNU459_g5458t2 [Dothideomycetes sp. NU459]